MRPNGPRMGWLIPVLLGLSCAGPAKLAQRSEVQLRNGDPEKAYEIACRALDKDAKSARATAALDAAALALTDAWKQRIEASSQLDTIAAARAVLELAALRRTATASPRTASPPALPKRPSFRS